jgi:hypothetical protein
MPDLKTLSTGTKIVLAAGLLLLIDTFFAWQEVSERLARLLGRRHGPDAIVVLVWVGVQVANVDLNVTLPDRLIVLILSVLILVFAILKNLTDDYSAWASVVGIVLAAALAVGAWMRLQEAEEAVSAGAAPRPPQAPTQPPSPDQGA